MAELSEPIGDDKRFNIQIDRSRYEVKNGTMTGSQLRGLPDPDIPADRDLFEVVPGGTDIKIEATTKVKMRDGLRFFTAPGHINPGCAG